MGGTGGREEKPEWLKVRFPHPEKLKRIGSVLSGLDLNTVCESAECPNRGNCYNRQTAAFMILGGVCTRCCRFCAVPHGEPSPPDPGEPGKVARAAVRLGLKHVVITSVTRDDLEDGGASHFAAVVQVVRRQREETTVEVLIPDFQGRTSALSTVIESGPRVLNHNLETVPRLYSRVRPGADYRRSIELLNRASKLGRSGEMLTKSGLMLGLGERRHEVLSVMHELREVGCDLLTLGQYLKPSPEHLPVVEYIPPEQFSAYREAAEKMGFRSVNSGPLVRSSFHADAFLPGDLAGDRAAAQDH